jgi:hypothetical protein
MRAFCMVAASLLLCAAAAASEPAPPRAAPDPLQGLTEQERAAWNSTVGFFCHAYVRSEQGDFARVPARAFQYICSAIRWHKNYIAVVGPKEIKQLEEKLANAKSQVRLGGTFGRSAQELRAQELLRERITDLERQLQEARAKLRQCEAAYSRGDLVTLESLGSPVLEQFIVGEIGAFDQQFTVKLVRDETTVLGSISKNGERFWVSLEGWPTGQLVTDRYSTLDEHDRTGIVTGTRGYETAEGGTKTALVIERVEVGAYLAGITQAQFIELLQTRGMTPGDFARVVLAAYQEKPKAYVDEVLRRLEAPPTKDDQQKTAQDE